MLRFRCAQRCASVALVLRSRDRRILAADFSRLSINSRRAGTVIVLSPSEAIPKVPREVRSTDGGTAERAIADPWADGVVRMAINRRKKLAASSGRHVANQGSKDAGMVREIEVIRNHSPRPGSTERGLLSI